MNTSRKNMSTMIAVVLAWIFIVDKSSAATQAAVTNNEYLGSQISKAYHFPWLVSIHAETNSGLEFFGSGTILTPLWVISSMDSFVRRSKFGERRPFYQMIDALTVYSGGVWGTPYLASAGDGPRWLQKRRVDEIRIFSDVNTRSASLEEFRKFSEPENLSTFKLSPFGLRMSVCLLKMMNGRGQNRIEWLWLKVTLPVPLLAERAAPMKIKIESEMEKLEKQPYSVQCYVGGWRMGDKRLVQYKVAYVPFEQCQAIYCGYDQRACMEWPVQGVHVCFKSLSFDEPCWTDQGSALYCTGISESAIAILTSAPTCGYRGLPGVYTLVHYALELYERTSPHIAYKPLTRNELLKYLPPPEQYLIPSYR